MVHDVNSRRDFLHTAGLALLGALAAPIDLLAQNRGAGEEVHTVRKGESLSLIARRHDVSVAALKTRNQLRTDVIRVGQKLVIPAKAPAGPPPVLAGVIGASRNLPIRRGRWKYIVTHHSGIENGNARTYHAEHLRRRWENGLGYHFVIGNGRDSGEGEIEVGPRWLKQLHGGHVRNEAYNEHGIGICLVGNFEQRRPTARQLASYHALVEWLRGGASLGATPRVTVHRWVDRNHTVCPGRHFPFDELRRRYGAA